MPIATSVTLSIHEPRLTPPDNDAKMTPISVPQVASLRAKVAYADGSTHDRTHDERMKYAVSDASCAEIHRTDGAVQVRILKGATCASVHVTAEFDGELTSSDSAKVVFAQSMEVGFTAFPNANPAVPITTLGLVQCSTKAFHGAKAHAYVYLSDGAKVEVTSESSFVSSSTAVADVRPHSQIEARGPGSANISATFGDTPTRSSATLTVVDNVVAWATQLELSTHLKPNSTVQLEAGSSQPMSVDVTFDNGVLLADIVSLSLFDDAPIIVFNSSDIETIGVDTMGTLTLHDNSHERIALSAALRCNAAVSHALVVAANLHPSVGDVDFGHEDGLQFQQRGDRLDVAVRIRTVDRAINFQLVANFDDSVLTSGSDATYTSGVWTGVSATLNDPSSSFQLVKSDPESNQAGLIDAGTVSLVVSGSGITLIHGVLIELITVDANKQRTRIEEQRVIAGQGFADVSPANSRVRRLRSLPGPVRPLGTSSSRVLATASRQPRALQDCDPCVSRIWGDVNGDCKFSSTDILRSQDMVNELQDYTEGRPGAKDPLKELKCDWLRAQANPSLDFDDNGKPQIDLEDSTFLLLAVEKRYRFLANWTASQTPRDAVGDDFVVRVSVVNAQLRVSLPSSPSDVDVLVELHSSAIEASTLNFTTGYKEQARGTSLGACAHLVAHSPLSAECTHLCGTARPQASVG